MRIHRETPRQADSAESGSAYLFVLLGLLVLTIIGLSLVVVTQTEAQIGGAEKSAARLLLGADSGLNAQLGTHMLKQTSFEGRLQVDTTTAGESIRATEEAVDLSPFLSNYTGPCNLCSVNYNGEQSYYLNNYAVNARSTRFGEGGCAETPQGWKRLTVMYMIQPEAEKGGGVTEQKREHETGLIDTDSACVTGLQEILY